MIPLAVPLRLVVVEVVVDAVIVVMVRIGVKNDSWRGVTLVCNRFSTEREHR
jgi:hypothetical protein